LQPVAIPGGQPIPSGKPAGNIGQHRFGHRLGQRRQIVGVERFQDPQQLRALQGFNQGISHRIRNLQQHIAAAFLLDLPPDQQSIILGQGFQDISDVGRMQAAQLELEFDHMLAVDQRFDQLVAGAGLIALHQGLDQTMLFQQLDDLSQQVLQLGL